MNAEEILAIIIKAAFTKAELQRRIRLIREYLETKFYVTGDVPKLAEVLVKKNASVLDIEALAAYPEGFFDKFDKEHAYDLLEQTSEAIKNLPVVSLYLPYEPSPKETADLGFWLRQNIGTNVLLDIHADPSIMGGCAFAWHGVYHDYSLRYYIQKHKQEIHDILTTYANSARAVV